MRFRRLALLCLLLTAVLAGLYAAGPFVAAYRLHSAVVRADARALGTMADWASVRTTLRASLEGRLGRAGGTPSPSSAVEAGLWQRIKARYAATLVDGTIERYITPESLPKLYAYRKTYNEELRPKIGLRGPSSYLAGTWLAGSLLDTALTSAARVQAIAFVSPTDFVIRVRDRYEATRSYRLAFQLRDWRWQLVGISIVGSLEPGL